MTYVSVFVFGMLFLVLLEYAVLRRILAPVFHGLGPLMEIILDSMKDDDLAALYRGLVAFTEALEKEPWRNS